MAAVLTLDLTPLPSESFPVLGSVAAVEVPAGYDDRGCRGLLESADIGGWRLREGNCGYKSHFVLAADRLPWPSGGRNLEFVVSKTAAASLASYGLRPSLVPSFLMTS
jgi:hypothetical protein